MTFNVDIESKELFFSFDLNETFYDLKPEMQQKLRDCLKPTKIVYGDYPTHSLSGLLIACVYGDKVPRWHSQWMVKSFSFESVLWLSTFEQNIIYLNFAAFCINMFT